MIKLIAFDWNGTLLADTPAVVEGTNKELEVLGLPPITADFYRQYFDAPIVEFYKKIGVDPAVFEAKSDQIAAAFHACYEPRAAKARTRAGVRKTLDYLHGRQLHQVIVSNHTTEGIYLQLERLKLAAYFDTVLAHDTITDSHFTGKEERLKAYLQQNHIAAAETVLVGDTVEEVRVGRNLGIKTISITGGYNTRQRLQAARPDFIINTITELPVILEEL